MPVKFDGTLPASPALASGYVVQPIGWSRARGGWQDWRPKATASDKLRAAFYAHFGFARKRPALYQLMFGPQLAFGQGTSVLREASETSFARLKAVIAQDFSLGDQPKQLNRATLAAWSLGHGLAALVTQSELHLPEGLPCERLVDQVLQGAALLFAPRP
jgi:hypothetical protein